MNTEIRKVGLTELELLMKWRMEVLREVFSVPKNQTMENTERENRLYYMRALPTGEHVACFAYEGKEIIGCGGVCFYSEMPSPDNESGRCAYLMNIYTCPEFRGNGVGEKITRWLAEQAKERGITKIYLEASESGRTVYKKIGFTDMCGYMQLKERK